MNKKNNLLLISLVTVSILNIFFNAYIAKAEMLEIGDENIWIVARAEGGTVDLPIVITDPKGRRVGFDPRTEKWIIEFDASYDAGFIWDKESKKYISVGSYLSDDEYKLYDTDVAFNLIPGDYIIEAIGKGLTKYSINITITHRIKGYPKKHSNFSFGGVIDKDLISQFKITYNPDPSANPGTGTKVSTPSSLKQDITLSRKISWIDNDGITNSLLKKVEAVESSIAKGNKETARNQLNAFINEVNAQNGKHISEKAANILLEDAKYMIERL